MALPQLPLSGKSLLGGIAALAAGGAPHQAPAQTVGDFLEGVPSKGPAASS